MVIPNHRLNSTQSFCIVIIVIYAKGLGGKNRDIIAQKMRLEDIYLAQALTAKYINSDYEDCMA